jgi:hypothetical protein
MCRVATTVCWDACISSIGGVCCFGEFGKQENRETNRDKNLLHCLKKGKHVYG